MENLGKKLAGATLAGMLMAGTFAAPAVADNSKDDGKGHHHKDKWDRHDERKNGEVDVVVKVRHHGKWYKKEYEDVKLHRAASIANYKCDDDEWKQHYKDARHTDRSGKTVKTCDEHRVKVYYKQDKDGWDHGHHHDDKKHDDKKHDDKKHDDKKHDDKKHDD